MEGVKEYLKKETVFREKYFLGCLLGILLALISLSLSEWQFLSYTLLPGPPVFISVTGQIVWTSTGFLIFTAGEICFFSSLMLLIEKKKMVESWTAYMGKTALFIVACMTLVQRRSGYTSFSSALLNGSFYLDNRYTGLVQSVVLTSIIISLSLVLTADFLMRDRMVEKPSEKFYCRTGIVTVLFGLVMIFLVFFKVPSYSFNDLPGLGYFYSQHILLSTVDSIELIGVFFLVLGCVVICFQRTPPLVKGYQLVSGSILTLLAFPLAFIPVQIWIERDIFYSSLLAPLDLDILHGIFPLNFNLFTYLSLILFMVGICVYVQKSKIKTLTLIAFLIYIYEYPGFHGSVLSNYYIPALTPTVPLPMYVGLAIASTIISIPLVTQKDWNVKDFIRRIFKPSSRTTIMLLVILAILIPIILLNSSRVTSAPLTQYLLASQSLSARDKIDPYLLNLNISSTEDVPVILRFSGPISQENIDRLNNTTDYDFFTFEKYNETYAIYSVKAYYAIYGNISADNSTDLENKLIQLVTDFPRSYILFNRNPSEPPNIDSHYDVYYFVGADILQAFNITGKGTTIAVVDSGVNDYAAELREKKNGRVIYQVNFLTGQEGDPRIVGELTPQSPLIHGTLVATDVAGVKGIAPDANIIDLKIKTGSGESFYMTCVYMAEALDWCVRNKDRFNISVVELALGSRYQVYGFLTDAVDRAFLNGIVVIVAAGGYLDYTKNHIGGLLTPGIADWGITVAATMDILDESWSPVSPLGPSPHWWLPKPELTGPGMFTSSSVPMVAGISLLLVQKYAEMGLPPLLHAMVIRWALIAGAQEYDLGPPGWDIQYGFGRANALTSFLYLMYYLQI